MGVMVKAVSMMTILLKYPALIFVVSLLVLWFAALAGARLRHRTGLQLAEELHTDFGVVLGATLTLLGLLIGFTFSMASTRYDLRRSYEEAEANAIGTEYVRADLLPDQAAQIRNLLRQYTDLRILFYTTRNDDLLSINRDTAQLQNKLWATVSGSANAEPNPVKALAVSGMNDVLNSQGYTQAAFWNRIPTAAWSLMVAIAVVCNVLFGYGTHRVEPKLLLILPLVVAVSFFLIADIDSPRHGVIRVSPQNLQSLRAGMSDQ